MAARMESINQWLMKIYLLTHERELRRKTNTGSIAVNHAGDIVERILWERTNPSNELLHLIENNQAVLLYPEPVSSGFERLSFNLQQKNSPLADVLHTDLSPDLGADLHSAAHVVIIDSTWQEARKIVNQSPYLKAAPRASLAITKPSIYKLRRNQPIGSLCTIECVIEILKITGHHELLPSLEAAFEAFNKR